MKTTLSRRGFAAALGAVPAAGQAPAQVPSGPEEELAQARDRMRRSAAQMAQIRLAHADEPAFVFKP